MTATDIENHLVKSRRNKNMDLQNRNILNFFFLLCFCIFVRTAEGKFGMTVISSSFTCTEHYGENCSSSYQKLDNGSYTWSMYADIMKPIYENVTIFFRSYEMKNGKYRKSILQFDKNFCEFVKSDNWMIRMIKGYTNLPNKCPIMPGPMYVKDLIAKEAQFPPGFAMESQWKFVFGMRVGDLELSDTEVEFKLEKQ